MPSYSVSLVGNTHMGRNNLFGLTVQVNNVNWILQFLSSAFYEEVDWMEAAGQLVILSLAGDICIFFSFLDHSIISFMCLISL